MNLAKQGILFYLLLTALLGYPSLAARLGSPSTTNLERSESDPFLARRKAAGITQARAEAVARRTSPADHLLHSQLELEEGS